MSQLTGNEKRKRPVSLFGPILLIAIGCLLLIMRLNPSVDFHWLDVLRLWPLFLIFVGFNILAQRAPRPWDYLLSGIIALVAVLVFGYVLINGHTPARVDNRLANINWQTESIHFNAEGINTAAYDFIIGPPGADIYSLEDSNELISGVVIYQDGYLFEPNVSGDRAAIHLAAQNYNEQWVSWPNFWHDFSESNRWQIGLNPNVPAELRLEAVAGSSRFDLHDLQLDTLFLLNNAGNSELLLPGGDYQAYLQTNAGVTEVALPESGRQSIDLQVNAGAVNLHLVQGMGLRVAVDQALGAFNVHHAGLRQVEGQQNVWQTAGYDEAKDRLDLALHINLGSVNID